MSSGSEKVNRTIQPKAFSETATLMFAPYRLWKARSLRQRDIGSVLIEEGPKFETASKWTGEEEEG